MKLLSSGKLCFSLLCAGLAAFCPWRARANVYATNLKLNGGTNDVALAQGSTVTLSYLLNEPATSGTAITIQNGATTVRTITVVAGQPGNLAGTNSVSWDGLDNSGRPVPGGAYSISVTAEATGFTNWTQTSSDTNAGNYVYQPRGIAVNVNPASPFYGRVFVGNAADGPQTGTIPGDTDGIIKLNADGSFAVEGQSDAGYSFYDDGFAELPQKLRYGMDDRLYFNDYTGDGKIVAVDMALTTNQVVLDAPNYADNPFGGTLAWFSFDVTDTETGHGRVWMGDFFQPNAGIWTWSLTNGAADPSDTTGKQAVAHGPDLTLGPSGGFEVDARTNIFVAQDVENFGQADPRALKFATWNGGTALKTAAWRAGSSDDTFCGVFDATIDSRTAPTYLACAMHDVTPGIQVLNAADGTTAATIDSGNGYWATAWDNVGNLYAASADLHLWRVFSPPGTNKATTVALSRILLAQPLAISRLSVAGGVATISFLSAPGDVASQFAVYSSAVVTGPYTATSGATITGSDGAFQATVPAGAAMQFYKIARLANP